MTTMTEPRWFHEVLSDGYRAFQQRVAARERADAERQRITSQGMTCDANDWCLQTASRVLEGVPCCDSHEPGPATPAVYGVTR